MLYHYHAIPDRVRGVGACGLAPHTAVQYSTVQESVQHPQYSVARAGLRERVYQVYPTQQRGPTSCRPRLGYPGPLLHWCQCGSASGTGSGSTALLVQC